MSYRRLSVAMIGSPSRIVHRSLPDDDPRQRQPDISRAQELLSWAPRTPLKEGLVRTITYLERLLTEEGVGALITGDMTA